MSGSSSTPDQDLQTVYTGYDTSAAVRRRWSGDNAGNNAMRNERDRILGRLLTQRRGARLDASMVLDAGSGWGHTMAWLHGLGVPAANLTGVDLMENRVAAARSTYKDFKFIQADVGQLDLPDAIYDLIVCSTLFSSIRDEVKAHGVALNIRRLLRKDGAVVWYDIRYPNPWNGNVRATGRSRIRALFPDLNPRLRSVTLLPQLSRRLGPAIGIYPLLAGLPPLRTHLVGLLEMGHA